MSFIINCITDLRFEKNYNEKNTKARLFFQVFIGSDD